MGAVRLDKLHESLPVFETRHWQDIHDALNPTGIPTSLIVCCRRPPGSRLHAQCAAHRQSLMCGFAQRLVVDAGVGVCNHRHRRGFEAWCQFDNREISCWPPQAESQQALFPGKHAALSRNHTDCGASWVSGSRHWLLSQTNEQSHRAGGAVHMGAALFNSLSHFSRVPGMITNYDRQFFCAFRRLGSFLMFLSCLLDVGAA
mmetsp:Transcript_37860/g.106968  ORF Transcript_37860/g.106968 Transcript_37860/m.106968 type:complete len:202 (-) Transcript_37860:1038-1643(-)